jgi:hypothetical protein
MPRSLLLRPLGGLTGKTRKRYALFQKIMLVEESDRLRLEQNFSIRRAGEVLLNVINNLFNHYSFISLTHHRLIFILKYLCTPGER